MFEVLGQHHSAGQQERIYRTGKKQLAKDLIHGVWAEGRRRWGRKNVGCCSEGRDGRGAGKVYSKRVERM